MYKLAVLDLDGTILDKKYRIGAYTLETIAWLGGRGIPVCISTGRSLSNSVFVADRLGLKTHIATIDGITLHCLRERKNVYENRLKLSTMERIVKRFEAQDCVLNAATDEMQLYYCEDDALYNKVLPKSNLSLKRFVFEKRWSIKRTKRLEELYAALPGTLELSVRHTGQESLLPFMRELESESFGEELRLYTYLDKMLLITPPTANKGTALLEICRVYGVPPEQVVAIGDEDNDVSMLLAAGMGVAMGSGADCAKAAADYVTGGIAEDGAAHALRKLFG